MSPGLRPKAARVGGFRIYVNGALRASVRATSYRVGGLRCGTSYVVAVAAYDASGRTLEAAVAQGQHDAVRWTLLCESWVVWLSRIRRIGNVGVPAGTTLTPSGSITVSTPGNVISGLNVTGEIDVNANNVTIRNTR